MNFLWYSLALEELLVFIRGVNLDHIGFGICMRRTKTEKDTLLEVQTTLQCYNLSVES